jgi:hypothetical protein
MTLEQAIHTRWAADAKLNAALPAERVTTGRTSLSGVPYATILRQSCRTLLRTNAGDSLDEITLRIHVWHDDHDAGRAITDAATAAFDQATFPLDAGRRVVQMRRQSEATEEHPAGKWQFTLAFTVQVYVPPPAE